MATRADLSVAASITKDMLDGAQDTKGEYLKRVLKNQALIMEYLAGLKVQTGA